MPLFIHRIGADRCGAAIDGGASRGIGDHHAVTKELGDELDIRGFTASGTGPGKLKEGLSELTSFHRCDGHQVIQDGELCGEDVIGNLQLLFGCQGAS